MSTLLIETRGGVGWITLNRPDKRNAINDEMRSDLAAAFAAFDGDAAVRCVVLTGSGTAFCAGVDLTSASPAAPVNPDRPRVTAPLEIFRKPVIAALNGSAVGGGLELALACDIRMAVKTAKFSLPEVKIGSLPGSGGTQRLPLVVGQSLAAEIVLSGEAIDAERALTAGLVSRLCDEAELLVQATALAERIAANAPLSILAAKKALAAQTSATLVQGLQVERALFLELSKTEDRQEGRAAFREKRKPEFKGR